MSSLDEALEAGKSKKQKAEDLKEAIAYAERAGYTVHKPKPKDYDTRTIDIEALTGKDPWIHAKEDNGKTGEGMEYAYLDLRKELGLFLEIYNEDRTGGHPIK